MDRVSSSTGAEPAAERPGSLFWIVWLCGLVAWQGWMTLSLFGPPEVAGQRLLSDEPVLSGWHPLHQYHGWLESEAMWKRGTVVVYDPAFQIGYLKTPVFDAGSRPGGLAQFLVGGVYHPAAYKIGLAASCMLMPFLLLTACWGVGLTRAATALATTAGLLVCWSVAGRRAIELGEADLLMAGLATLAHVGLLVRYHTHPGLLGWLGLVFTGALAWFAQPILLALLLPLLCIYYLSIGPRHAALSWHGGLIAGEVIGVAVNLVWFIDYVNHWWLRLPLEQAVNLLRHRTFRTLWEAPLWGPLEDKELGVVLLVSAIIGVAIFNQTQQRVAARLLGLGALSLWLLALLSIAWQPLGRFGTSGLLTPALCFAALPAAYAWTQGFRVLSWLTGGTSGAIVALGLMLIAVGSWRWPEVEMLATRWARAEPLVIGLDDERRTLVLALEQHTSADARILLEDQPTTQEPSRWTALLPLMTGRAFIGGLDGDAVIEHSHISLIDGNLAGKPLAKWKDDELQAYCQRYNVAWVLARSPAAQARFRDWKGTTELTTLGTAPPRVLFAVPKATRSFVLKGKAQVLHADSQYILLGDVVPTDEVVILSLHYHEGLRASPSRVTLEPVNDPNDPIPLLRLRMEGPAALVTLRWGE